MQTVVNSLRQVGCQCIQLFEGFGLKKPGTGYVNNSIDALTCVKNGLVTVLHS